MRIFYHRVMLRINSFLFGPLSTNAHKHVGRLIVLGFKKGFMKHEKSQKKKQQHVFKQ